MSKETKAQRKERQKAIRAIAWTLLGSAVMGDGDDDLMIDAALQLIVLALANETSPQRLEVAAVACESMAARLREQAERGDPERDS